MGYIVKKLKVDKKRSNCNPRKQLLEDVYIGLDLRLFFSYNQIFRYYLYLHQWFKLKKTITSWKYLHDDIYYRAHDSVHLKKYKFRHSIYLYDYSCVKILCEIATPMTITIGNNWTHLQCKFKSLTKMVKWLVLKE